LTDKVLFLFVGETWSWAISKTLYWWSWLSHNWWVPKKTFWTMGPDCGCCCNERPQD